MILDNLKPDMAIWFHYIPTTEEDALMILLDAPEKLQDMNKVAWCDVTSSEVGPSG